MILARLRNKKRSLRGKNNGRLRDIPARIETHVNVCAGLSLFSDFFGNVQFILMTLYFGSRPVGQKGF